MPLEGSFPAMYVGGSAYTYFLLEAKVGKEDPFMFYSMPCRKFSIPMLANQILQKKSLQGQQI